MVVEVEIVDKHRPEPKAPALTRKTMVDTIKFEMLLAKNAPPHAEIAEPLRRLYRGVEKRAGTTFGDATTCFTVDGGEMLPTGTGMLLRSGRWQAEISLGRFLHHHNAHLLSFDDAERAIRQYLGIFHRMLPYADIKTAVVTRLDIYYQWRVSGDWDRSKLHLNLGDRGPCRRMRVYSGGTTAMFWRSNHHGVKLYDKSVEIEQKRQKDADLNVVLPGMPEGVVRLEVGLHASRREVRSGFGLPVRGKKESRSPLRKLGVLTNCDAPVLASCGNILNRGNIVQVLQDEWPDVVLAPIYNAPDLICAHGGRGAVAAVLHGRPELRRDFLVAQGRNRSSAVRWLRSQVLEGPSESHMGIPRLEQLETMFASRQSPFFVQEVHTASLDPDCGSATGDMN